MRPDELEAKLAAANNKPLDELPVLIADCKAAIAAEYLIIATCQARIPAPSAAAAQPEEWLSPQEASDRFNLGQFYFYRPHVQRLGFACGFLRHVPGSDKLLQVSVRKFEEYRAKGGSR
jgi:hypothetical protein